MKLPKIRIFLILIPILAIYFLTRFQNLNQIPVFGDEAIYIRWAQLIKNVETLRFVPLTDGKQPLFMWLNAATLKVITDPLVSGRIISIFAGAGILTTLFTISILFFNLNTAIISCFLYISLPFSFFFDRMALADNLLSFFGLVSLLFSLLLAKYPRLDLSLILGFSLGLSWLTKSPAVYFLVLSFLTFFLFNISNLRKIYFPIISAFIGYFIYNILRLGPQFHQIALRNQDYIWTVGDILKHPLDPLIPHLKDILSIYSSYLSLPLILLSLFSFLIFKKYFNQKLILVIVGWWLLPLISNAVFAKVFTARYILFTLPPLILLFSIFLSKIKLNLFVPLFFIASLLNLFNIYRLSSNAFNVHLISTESGYLNDWTSGWGIKSASQYLINRSLSANVIVGTEGYFGTLPDGLQIYTDGITRLTIFGVGLDLKEVPFKLIDAHLHGDEVYLLINQSRLTLPPSEMSKLELVNSYPKPLSDSLQLFRLR